MADRKPLIFIGSTLKDLQAFPTAVQRVFGYALHVAQLGGKHPDAKPLKGFTGAGVLEVVEDRAGDTYRVVYTVRLGERVYALHAFQEKSKRGVATPKLELDLVRKRLADAEDLHRRWIEGTEGT
jgi:phage-related protein